MANEAILDDEPWSDLGERGFDPPDHFAAFLNTLRWNCTYRHRSVALPGPVPRRDQGGCRSWALHPGGTTGGCSSSPRTARATKRFLRRALEAAIEGTDRAGERIEVIDGLVGGPRRKEIQRRFNTTPRA